MSIYNEHRVDALLKVQAYAAPRFTQPNVQEIIHVG